MRYDPIGESVALWVGFAGEGSVGGREGKRVVGWKLRRELPSTCSKLKLLCHVHNRFVAAQISRVGRCA